MFKNHNQRRDAHVANGSGPLFEELESRLLLSADAAGVVVDPEPVVAEPVVVQQIDTEASAPEVAAAAEARKELVLIDPRVGDYAGLVSDLLGPRSDNRQIDVFVLDPTRDGIEQVSEALNGRNDLSALHVISHGATGAFDLGGTQLNFESLLANATAIQGWGDSFTEDADIMLYGCNVGASADGQQLIDALSRLTGTDVAASDDPTGNIALGGDWLLEVASGAVETVVAPSNAMQANWQHLLVAPVINSNGGGATAAISVAENTSVVTTVSATDADLQALTYSIVGGADAALFTINATSGVLSFLTPPDFQAPGDAGANNVYDVTVQVSDTTAATDTQALAITVERVGAQGSETRVNTTTANTQNDPSVGIDANGNYVVVWMSDLQDGSGGGVYAQRYNASGVAQGSEFRVNTTTAGTQNDQHVAMAANGNFVIVWVSNDASGGGVYAQRYDAAGVAQGSEFLVNTTTANTQDDPMVAMDASGNFVVTWASDLQDGSGGGVYAQRYNASGVAQGSEFRVNTTTANTQNDPSVAVNASGNFVITWTGDGQDGSGTGVYAQRYNASGVAQGSEFRANTTTANAQNEPVVGIDDDGKFIVAWVDAALDGSSNGIYAQRYDATGVALGGEFLVNAITSGSQRNPAISMHPSGGFFVTWQGPDASGTTDGFFRQFDVNGNAVTGDIRVNTTVSGTQSAPWVASNNNGNIVAVWAGEGTGDTSGIFMQRYGYNSSPTITSNGATATATVSVAENTTAVTVVTATDVEIPAQTLTYSIVGGADAALFVINSATGALSFVTPRDFQAPGDAGTNNVYDVTVQVSDGNGGTDTQALAVTVERLSAQGSETRVNSTTANAQNDASVAMDANGNFVVAWASQLQDGSGYGVYAQRYNASGVAQGGEFLVNTTTASDQNDTVVAMDVNGNFIVSWTGQDGSGRGVYAQRFNASGVAQGGEFRVNTTTASSQNDPAIGVDASGNFVIAWTSNLQDGSGPGVYAQRYNASGVAQGGEVLVNTTTANTQNDPAIAVDASGNFVIAWMSDLQDGSGNGVYAQRYNAAGVAQGSEFRVSTMTANDQNNTGVGMDASGNFVIVWASNLQDGNGYGVYAQRYNAAGVAQGGEVLVNTLTAGDQTNASVSMSPAGGFFVTWEGQDSNVYIKQFDASGSALTGDIQISTTISGAQLDLSITSNDKGHVVVTWQGNGTGDSDGVFMQRYTYNVAPVITSDGAGASASLSVNENATAVTTVAATDSNVGDTLTYSITGGADAALFTINASSGVLTFLTARNFESPADAGGNNVYDVTVQVSDGNGGSDTQAIAVTITNVNEAPSGTNTTVTTNEDTAHTFAVVDFGFTDPDAGDSLSAVRIDTLPVAGSLTLSGVAVTAGQIITAANITAGNLVFTPAADASGASYASFTFSVRDQSAVFDASPDTLTINVTSVNDAPTITSNGGGATASVSIAENTTAVTTTTSTDVDVPAQTLTYSIVGGADQALFTINSSTGALSFLVARNFESPADAGGNNVYDVTVQVSDGNGGSDTQAIAITITDANEAPTGADATITITEDVAHTFVTGNFGFTDIDAGDALSAVRIDTLPATGSLTLSGVAVTAGQVITVANITAGNLVFTPASDASGSPYANFTFSVRDQGAAFDASPNTLTINVTSANDAPVITSNGGGATASVSIAENTTAVTTVTATDIDVPAQTLTYSITGGADAALFTINSSTGALSFAAARNFESPADAGANNVYDVTVQVSDGNGGTDTQAIAVTVTNANEAPAGTDATVTTNQDVAHTFTLANFGFTDPDAGDSVSAVRIDTLPAAGTLTLSGVAVTAGQVITAANITGGNLVFTPVSGAMGSPYANFTFSVRDQGAVFDAAPNTLTINVTDVNDAPVITSNAGGATASVSIAENTTAVTTVTATDVDVPAQTLTYSITGGADAALFTINASSGVLTFLTARNFESPADAGANNVYDVTVQVSDGNGGTDTQAIAVTVTDVNEAPAGTNNTLATNEDTAHTFAAADFGFTDPDAGDSLSAVRIDTLPAAGSLTLSGVAVTAGQVITVANITAGNLVFTPAANANGASYASFTFSVRDQSSVYDAAPNTLTVNVTSVNDAPTITSNGGGATASVSIAENTTAVTTVTATDIDLPAQTMAYSIVGGADAALFTINSTTGALSFAAARNFESPADAGGNNVYDVTVQVSDGNAGSDTQAIAVTITDANEAPAGTNNTVATNEDTAHAFTVADFGFTDPDAGDSLSAVRIDTLPAAGSLTLSGVAVTAGQVITVANITAGNLVFTPASEASGAPYANFTFSVRDQSVVFDASPNTLTVNVASINDTPVITSNGGGATASVSIAENTTAVTTITATDVDVPAQTLAYSITGGADAALFTINSSTGVLSFLVARNFEVPGDAGGNNVYDVTVQVSDGNGGTDTQAIAVTITNVNEAPAITSDGAGATAAVSITENTTAVTTVTATDVDAAQTMTYSIVGGADAARFTINSATGALSFTTAPDFEAPSDTGANNMYDVTVQVSDGNGGTDTQAIAVTVINGNETPVLVANTGMAVPGGSATTITNAQLEVTDVDNAAAQLVYTLTAAPTAGVLELLGVAMNAGDTFTQADLNANRVMYRHVNATVASDNFGFTVSDGAGGAIGQTSFAITASIVIPPPTPIVPPPPPPTGGPVPPPPTPSIPPPTPPPVSGTGPAETAYQSNHTPLTLKHANVTAPTISPVETEIFIPTTSEPAPQVETPTKRGSTVHSFQALGRALDGLRKEMDQNNTVSLRAASATSVSGAILTVGFVSWLLRSGALISSLMATAPLWNRLDPVPILAGRRKERDDEDRKEQISVSRDRRERSLRKLFQTQSGATTAKREIA